MEVVCSSKHLATSITTALDVEGREHLVVVAKATWRIPAPGERPRPLPPEALAHADLFHGAPGESAMRYGSDFVRHKPRCDVLFDACAHSPDGRPVRELQAGWRLGDLQKSLQVHGPRTWRRRLGGAWALNEAEPFERMPLHYGLAFGGAHEDARQPSVLLANPVGIGWPGSLSDAQLEGHPAPCLEAVGQPVQKPRGNHQPAAFSAVARHWAPRKDFAGTYDAQWQEDVFPFLPEDHDEQFNQCAPRDQQMDYPHGGEEVVFHHLMQGRPRVHFRLPPLDGMGVRVLRTDYSTEAPVAAVDTLFFEPDAGRFSAVWRASTPIRRRLQEFDVIAIGPVDPAWWAARQNGSDSGCTGCGEPSLFAAPDVQARAA